jgi:acyl-CoA thioester hydrolase, YbgC/YbaW family
MKRRVYYYDTDCGGVVYHANYLNFFEEARTQILDEIGYPATKLMELDCYFVVHHQEIFYKYPAKYGDVLDIQARTVEVSPVRMEIEYTITNQDGKLTTTGSTSMVCVGKDGHPHAWPQDFIKKLPIFPKAQKPRRI